MEWQSVTDEVFPNDAGVIEVQLANGCILLACYANHAWRVPLVGGLKAGQKQAEISNVVRWRTYLPVSQATKKQKTPSPRTGWRTQTTDPTPPAE